MVLDCIPGAVMRDIMVVKTIVVEVIPVKLSLFPMASEMMVLKNTTPLVFVVGVIFLNIYVTSGYAS